MSAFAFYVKMFSQLILFLGVEQHLTDADLIALMSDEIFQPQVIWSLGDLQANSILCFLFCAS